MSTVSATASSSVTPKVTSVHPGVSAQVGSLEPPAGTTASSSSTTHAQGSSVNKSANDNDNSSNSSNSSNNNNNISVPATPKQHPASSPAATSTRSTSKHQDHADDQAPRPHSPQASPSHAAQPSSGGSVAKPRSHRRSRRGKALAASSGDDSDGGEHSGKHRPRKEKTGHRTVNTVTGEVKYKKVKSTELMAAIQMGMRQAIGYTMQKKKRDILMQDFQEVESLYYPREGTNSTPPHKFENFKFYTYAPRAYRHFRDIFNIDTADFLLSMCHKPLRELSNPGASGSLFWLSHDDRFIVKTIQKGEHKFLTKLLPQYYLNLHQNKRTLLPKFFAHFCYKSSTGRHIRFIVMNNILPSHLEYQERYDLKGSTRGRFASEREKQKKSPTLKDLDFNDIHEEGLTLPSRTYDRLCNTLQRDCRILRSYKIMDYSLLLGIHNITRASQAKPALPATSAHQFTISTHAANEYFPHSILISDAPEGHDDLNGRYRSAAAQDKDGHPWYSKDLRDGGRLYLLYRESDKSWIISSDPSGVGAIAALNTTHAQPLSDIDTPWRVLSAGDKTWASAPGMASALGRRSPATSGAIGRGRGAGDADDDEQAGARASNTSPSRQRLSLSYQIDEEEVDVIEQETGGLIAYNEKGEKLLIFLGIIDILQSYGMRKKLEHTYKSVVFDGDSVSVHRPGFYQNRFQEYLTQRVFRAQLGPGNTSTDNAAQPQSFKRRGRTQSFVRTRSRNASQRDDDDDDTQPKQQPLDHDQHSKDQDQDQQQQQQQLLRPESPRVVGVTLMSDDDVRRSRDTSPRSRRRRITSTALDTSTAEDEDGDADDRGNTANTANTAGTEGALTEAVEEQDEASGAGEQQQQKEAEVKGVETNASLASGDGKNEGSIVVVSEGEENVQMEAKVPTQRTAATADNDDEYDDDGDDDDDDDGDDDDDDDNDVVEEEEEEEEDTSCEASSEPVEAVVARVEDTPQPEASAPAATEASQSTNTTGNNENNTSSNENNNHNDDNTTLQGTSDADTGASDVDRPGPARTAWGSSDAGVAAATATALLSADNDGDSSELDVDDVGTEPAHAHQQLPSRVPLNVQHSSC